MASPELPRVVKSYAVRRGDAWAGEVFTWTALGFPSDFWTGATFKAQLREYNDGPLIFEFTLPAVLYSSAAGPVVKCALSLAATDTAAWTPGATYIGEIELFGTNFPKMSTVDLTFYVDPQDSTHA
jgi:hypothetical protein